jgi:succinyl-CoA synthetase beta subunit
LEARAPATIKEVQALAAPPPAIADALAAGATTLGEIECQSLLLSAGIGVPRGAVARSADEARGIAADLHGPVVLKVIAAGLAHKTDAGGVLVGISGSEAVTRAFEEVTERVRRARPDLAVTGVLVQEAIPEGPELLVGISHDPQFGAVVSVGLGGILTELLDDVVLRLAPIDRDTATSMLQTLRGARIFDGWRGRPVVSLDAAAAAISRISFLAVELAPWVASLEVNPLILTPSGPVAVDGLLALRQPPVLPDGP